MRLGGLSRRDARNNRERRGRQEREERHEGKEGDNANRLRSRVDRAIQELKEAVRAGKISGSDARRRLQELRKESGEEKERAQQSKPKARKKINER